MNDVIIEPTHNLMLVSGPLDPGIVSTVSSAWLSDGRIGAISSFCGVVRRDLTPEGPVEAIEFSAPAEMAIDQLQNVTKECAESLGDVSPLRVYLQHALGRVAVGECPIVIVVGAGHRREAFRLCMDILDTVKQEVPIYGKEIVDGGHRWKVNR